MLNESHGFQYNETTQIDEHDEPTEPMRRADVAAFVPTIPNTVLPPDEEDVPSPKSATHPFPSQYVQPASSLNGGFQHSSSSPPSSPTLPVMPVLPYENSPVAAKHSSPQKRVRSRMIPLVVGMCFVALQTLLLFRFVLKVVNVSSDSAWVGMVYGVSNVFVLPFRVLFLQLAIPQLFTVELYTLLAILAYGLVSRIVVHLLKVLFKTR